MNWGKLKDFGRKFGIVEKANVYTEQGVERPVGIITYRSIADVEPALSTVLCFFGRDQNNSDAEQHFCFAEDINDSEYFGVRMEARAARDADMSNQEQVGDRDVSSAAASAPLSPRQGPSPTRNTDEKTAILIHGVCSERSESTRRQSSPALTTRNIAAQ